MSSKTISVDTYKVLFPFTAEEGDSVVILYGACIGLEKASRSDGVTWPGLAPAQRTLPLSKQEQTQKQGQKQPTVDEVCSFMRKLHIGQQFTAKSVIVAMKMPLAGLHRSVTHAIQYMLKTGEIERTPICSSHGPYIRTSIIQPLLPELDTKQVVVHNATA